MSWVEGLLGAVMGGAQEYGSILKEEETAKRKEEEEKRREDRALTLAERKADAEQKRKQTLEEQERARVAKLMGPETRMTPAASPMEPEGIVQSQIPLEERLKTGAEKAFAAGDQKAAKNFLEQYQTLKDIEAKAAEEARKQQLKPEKDPEAFRALKAKISAAYSGKRDESGKPVNQAEYDAYEQAEMRKSLAKEQYIRPERPQGEDKPLTPADRLKFQNAISGRLKDRARVQEKEGKDPVFKQDVYSDLTTIANKIAQQNPESIRVPDLVADEAYRQYQDLSDRAKQSVKEKWTSLNTKITGKSDADRQAEAQRRKELEEVKKRGIATEKTYIERNYKPILRGLIGSDQKKEEKEEKDGLPWTRNWGAR